MRATKPFPFDKARRITGEEVEAARRAIEIRTGRARLSRGRPPKPSAEKFRAISIRLHPKVILWAKREAKMRGVGYQTVINEVLLRKVA